jgi:excisionase family DNA binding protein
MSTVEVAQALGLSPWAVRALVRRGKLRPARLTRKLAFTEEEVERAVRASQESNRPALQPA